MWLVGSKPTRRSSVTMPITSRSRAFCFIANLWRSELTSIFCTNDVVMCCVLIGRGLKQRRQWSQQERQKSNMLRLAKQQLCKCITLFCTFLCRHSTTTAWKCLISRFVENVNTREHLHFSFPELRYSLLELNSTPPAKIANIWRTEGDGISAIKFEEARLRSRRRRCCWSSLISLKTWGGGGGWHPW